MPTSKKRYSKKAVTKPTESTPNLGRRFWTVWTAATASNIGDGIILAALPLLAAQLTREPVGIAATTIAVRLPWLAFGLFAGVVVDRTDRLRIMITTDIGRAVAFAAIAVVVASGELTLSVLYLVVFGVGVLETLFDTAAMSITPSLVVPGQLERANARISGAQIAANEFVGPPLGGVVFAIAAAAPFVVNAGTFAFSALILLMVGGRFKPHRTTRPSVAEDIRVGISFVWREPLIRAFAIGAGTINLGFTAGGAVLVLHAQDNVGLSDVGFGLLLASAAIGGVAGAQVAPRTIAFGGRRNGVLASIPGLAFGVALMGVANHLWTAALGFALFGFAGEIWNVVSVTYRQSITPDELLGRVMSGFRVVAYGAFPVGAAVGGLIASTIGIRAAFFVGATIIALLLPYLALMTNRHDLDGPGPASSALSD